MINMKQLKLIIGIILGIILVSFEPRNIYCQNIKEDIPSKNKPTLIERLKPNETLIIAYSISGCFSDTLKFQAIKIKREENDYTLFFNDKSKRLTEKEFEMIKKFEIELDIISTEYKCTTNAHYLLRYNKITKNRIDNSCYWHGFERLLEYIFYI